MKTIRLTMAQAIVRYLINQKIRTGNETVPYFGGVWAIFGHGNVAGMGEALQPFQDELPTYRGHNEQSMAHAAIAYAKAHNRRRTMAVTSSIGPGATNMVTAAALAHVNRLPVLFLPGDVFANRRPDPVLQQIESQSDGTVSANDCFRPVSNYFDRLTRPEQILAALPRMMATFTDPGLCGPVTLAICQDVQAEAYDYPAAFFDEHIWQIRRPRPDQRELDRAADIIRKAKKPLVIAGGGVLYSGAEQALTKFSERFSLPVAETQAGKGALLADHHNNLGSLGVTGTSAANTLAAEADVIIAIGTRLQDFTSGSRALFQNPERVLIQLNVTAVDSHKHGAEPLMADALEGITALSESISNYSPDSQWQDLMSRSIGDWNQSAEAVLAPTNTDLPSDAQVIGGVARSVDENTIVVCAAGGLPGELHKLWRAQKPNGYHVEYGYSCMGYEIAGGLGVKMAHPDRQVVVMVGDGSYMMMNSELSTSVMLGHKIIVVVLDNHGFGCINRLQHATGGKGFNNLLADAKHQTLPAIDFSKHAESLGAKSEKVASIAELEQAMVRARDSNISYVIVIETAPLVATEAGGAWWDVAVPETSPRKQVQDARASYEKALPNQRIGY